MNYEKSMELSRLSIQHWVSNEVFSFGWFLILGVLLIVYGIWLKLLDKKRAVPLLLIGSLAAFAYLWQIIIFDNILGLVSFNIRLLPMPVPLFIHGVTIAPIIIMISEQYATSWKSYMLRSGIGFAILCFALIPIDMLIGIAQFHNWNVFYHFLAFFGLSIIVRLVFLWIAGTQKRHNDAPAKA